ncbi:hypothetical protein [Vibrio agarivorans]|uniref:DUF975 domain-containing protein n=1 Tax=Vibrio agarivorans TaxID=153622 RepID=A0ABT7XZ71_9VIBR|nr:hypothetical protein [Vibrio agarivorans]MDN2481087.1 hypothetical protein [Vibrio agarivorans]
MTKDIKREFNVGGNLERALSGDYSLRTGEVLREATSLTVKHFMRFTPAILLLLFAQLAIFYIALKLQVGDLSVILDMVTDPDSVDANVVQAIFMANFSYEVISAPFFAGVSLMAMSHAAGLETKTRHIAKGLQFTIPVILATLAGLVLQGVAGMLLPFVSLYLSLAFTNSTLLICEKRVPPMSSLWLSLRAVNKKILPLAAIYITMMCLFVAGAMLYGIGLIFVLPLFFHVKAIIYREMFGIRLKVVASQDSHHDDNDHSDRDDNNEDSGSNGSDENDSNDANGKVFNA